MPGQQHFYGLNELDNLTRGGCRRARRWSEKKRLKKLNYMHQNPVKRRLVPFQLNEPMHYTDVTPTKARQLAHGESLRIVGTAPVEKPGDWPWSWRFYHLGDESILAMDRMP